MSEEIPPETVTEDEFTAFLGDFDSATPGGFEEVGVVDPPVDDLPPIDDTFDEATITIGDGTCDVCGAPTFRPPGLTAAGRKKRVPKRCDLHARNVRIPEDGPFIGGVESQLKRIQEELADDVKLLGTLTGPIFPVTGYYIFEHADPFTIAILKLAKNNQRILRVLHRAAQVAPVYTVAECVAGTAYAIQVDQKKADPHSNIARRLGVTRAYDSIYSSYYDSNGNSTNSNDFNAPPRYATVQ